MLSSGNPSKKSWSEIISDQVLQWMKIDKDIVSITPAMIKGSAMNNLFKVFQERCFDVGIAEEHALTFTAGLSISQKKTFYFLSTLLFYKELMIKLIMILLEWIYHVFAVLIVAILIARIGSSPSFTAIFTL